MFWLNGFGLMKLYSVLIFSLLFSLNISANDSGIIKSSFENYKRGSYGKVISSLENLKVNSKTRATKHYLIALSYNRLQQYDRAIRHFRKALKSGSKAQDIYYEYGQALYADSELTKARASFKKSFRGKYKPDSSLYYVAHISQILEQNKKAKRYYVKMLKSKTADKDLLQVARFQLGEVLLTMARKATDPERLVDKFVLPQIDKAIAIKKESSLADEIRSRKKEIEREFGLDPNMLRNGRVISSKRWNISIDEKVSYDNNISLTSDLASSTASREDSYIFETTFNSSYNLIFKKRFVITPSLGLSTKSHTNKDSEAVRAEDNYNIDPSLNSTYEHKLFLNPASLLFNIEYNYKGRFRKELSRRTFYSRYLNVALGEKFQFFIKGETTIKFEYKDLKSYIVDLHSKTKSFSVDQVYYTTSGHLFIFLLKYDALDSYNSTASSTNATLLRVDFIHPTFLPKITLHVGASMSFTDYTDSNESLSRGVEKTFAPIFKLTKKISEKLQFAVSYEYTNNTSLEADSKYSKHITSTQLSYSF
ncbi:hypothetical protein A9Q84_11605 [Halobacteriovorax marinus]|uniref:Uncharacterized protein n=1 Tax=Halobacteriovorax marinus TaxID=97084 RepID=A0A1Y5F861_9BACT|nr:hypothetical protein A9Q84_11605 [Halobacteriovorax marinus]